MNEEYHDAMTCPDCRGLGYVGLINSTKTIRHFDKMTSITCTYCYGKGLVDTDAEFRTEIRVRAFWANGG